MSDKALCLLAVSAMLGKICAAVSSHVASRMRARVLRAWTVFIPALCPGHRAPLARRKWFTQNVFARNLPWTGR
jgi:hypothetical protein